jgi:conserved repeat domain
MQTNKVFLILMLFTGLILLGGVATASNLSLSKTVQGDSTYQSGETITWVLTVTNHNETSENQINVTEMVPPGCAIVGYQAENGTLKDTLWTLNLTPDSTGTLKINMTCTQACGSRSVVNIANITAPKPSLDALPADNNASRSVTVQAPACTTSNLSLKKSVIGRSTSNLSETIVWRIEATNHNTSASIPVQIAEQAPAGCTIQQYNASKGTVTGDVWSVNLTANGSANLDVRVSCPKVCGTRTLTNTARITSPAPSVDASPSDNTATSPVTIEAPACAGMTVRPITLNLKSKGVLTVFFTIGGQMTSVEEDEEDDDDDSVEGVHIDREASSLSCNGVDASKILFSMKNGGTVIGKFPRQALELEVDEGTASLDCEGSIVLSNGTVADVQGNTTLKVIHAEARQQQSLIQRILAFLGLASQNIDEEDDDSDVDTTPTIDIENVKNFGQLKKVLKNTVQEDDPVESETTVEPVGNNGKGKPDNPGKGNDKKDKENDQNKGKGNSN